jgi:enamine deaminase RidA (YjgF/YER057c/UK114 family)
MIERVPMASPDGAKRSLAVVHGELVFFSGLSARDTSGDARAQTSEVLRALDAALAEVGASQRTLFCVHVWLKDMRDFGAMNAAWNAWADDAHPPARTCVQGALYRPDVLVEIVATAFREARP